MTAHDWVDGWCRGCGRHEGFMNLTSACDLTVAQARQALTGPNTQTRPPVTRLPLELLADWLEAERDEPAATRLLGRPMTARLEDARAAVLALDPAALRAQAEADAQVRAERDSLLSGLRDAVQAWTQKRDSNRRDGDRRSAIIYSAVVSRALDILNDREPDEHAQAAIDPVTPASVPIGRLRQLIHHHTNCADRSRSRAETADPVIAAYAAKVAALHADFARDLTALIPEGDRP